ncbi:hypothetical protein KKF55_03605 [Patescibacteria group bacterium]|nr:hypothetical protein [Patescibacteria group bacterium]
MQILGILTGLVLVLIPQRTIAITLGTCPVTDLSCNGDLSGIIYGIATVFAVAFGGFLFAMFAFYGIKLLVSTGDENAQSEVRSAIVYAIFGSILVAGAQYIADSFTTSGTIVDVTKLEDSILSPVKSFITGLLAITLIVTITYQGIRLVIADDESQSSAARKRFIEGLIGAAVIILVDTIVDAFIPGTGMGNLKNELAGISKYLATIFGFLAVIAIMSGGIFLAFSATDSYKEKGKQMIFAGIISLVVVWVSYALVKLFIT